MKTWIGQLEKIYSMKTSQKEVRKYNKIKFIFDVDDESDDDAQYPKIEEESKSNLGESKKKSGQENNKMKSFAQATAVATKDNYNRVSQRFKEEPAGEVFIDEATKVASKSAELGTQVYQSTKTKMSDFVQNGGIEGVQSQAVNSAKTIGSSFWNFVCKATQEDQEKMGKGSMPPPVQTEDNKSISGEKPL
eukprot:CAMPEP_0205801988 /NCGR_PEP_ID=MMETSP0205-20121125/4162_1 /ASSEMBLY_ACC=CAM_ASM_000278 /TAXON_ID=36767 /ORGANISM="Euplotes focardii, Strain TN1" /LENGTH=190 /DNA_ID=CAMNT_0053067657 /DNA_START=180 /DNA_END=749 /DNA_ORIENTATION=+